MEKRKNPYTISRPQPLPSVQAVQDEIPVPLHPNALRPLSDIRELSEPSLIDSVIQRAGSRIERGLRPSKATPFESTQSLNTKVSSSSRKYTNKAKHVPPQAVDDGSSSYSSTPEQSSFYTIPYSSVPRRSSSQTHAERPRRNHARNASVRVPPPPSHPNFEGFFVPNRGHSRSPVKHDAVRSDAVHSDMSRRVPSKTRIRTPHALDILEFPSYRHPRVKLELRVSAPLFVGGGSIEGYVKITIDENERSRSRRSLSIGTVSVDLIGFEDMPNGRRATFLAVGTELIDAENPPPASMVEPRNPLISEESFWTLMPAVSALPFMISLPLDTGPPPFQSKIANIRFLLCATALISEAAKHYRVRTSYDVSVLATYDPEKALTSLQSPLTANDEISLPRFGRCETLKVTAGLHRQVWVSGSSIFVDVHIVNSTHRPVKRLELSLERDILCYKHASAATNEKSASQARIFESNEQTMITRLNLKPGHQSWDGVQPHATETRTYELQLPRGHATIRCGKYFEVRFFLNVTVSLSNTKLVSVQLPIILIHMNSLDVLPNSVAQVAAAIEEKRANNHRRSESEQHNTSHTRQRSTSSPAAMAEVRRRPSYSQGRAFQAPIQQFAIRQRAMRSELDNLRDTLDSSPRKYEAQVRGVKMKKADSNISIPTFKTSDRKSKETGPLSKIGYHTPPRIRPFRHDRAHNVKPDLPQDRLRHMPSFESMWSRRKDGGEHSKKVPDLTVKPQYSFTILREGNGPPAIRLASENIPPSSDRAAEHVARPATSLSFREKTDRKRFEFKGVKQKTSGSLKERGLNWLEQVKHKDKEKEGWI